MKIRHRLLTDIEIAYLALLGERVAAFITKTVHMGAIVALVLVCFCALFINSFVFSLGCKGMDCAK